MKTISRLAIAITIVAIFACFGTLLSAEGTSSGGKRIVIEDFEAYTNDTQVAKAWYKPHHGAPVHQSLDRATKGGGKQGLRIAYSTTKESATHYAPFCRVARWDLTGCNAAQFWFQPDGSVRDHRYGLAGQV